MKFNIIKFSQYRCISNIASKLRLLYADLLAVIHVLQCFISIYCISMFENNSINTQIQMTSKTSHQQWFYPPAINMYTGNQKTFAFWSQLAGI